MQDFMGLFILIIILFVLYFLPTFISSGKIRFWQVFWINLLLGRSLVGRVVALVIAIDKSNIETEDDPEDVATKDKFINIDIDGEHYRVGRGDQERVAKVKNLFDKGLITKDEFLEKTKIRSRQYNEKEEYDTEIQLQALIISFENGEISKEEYEARKKPILDKMIQE